MANVSTGQEGVTALAALMRNKTIGIAGDSTATTGLENLYGDASTRVLSIIEYEHHEIHAGSHFFFTDANTINAASTDAVDYLLIVPNTTKWPHMVFEADGTAVTSFYLYEDVNVATSDGWTQMTAYNNNRNSSADPTMEIWRTIGSATASSDYGEKPILEYSSGAASQQSKTPAAARAEREIILGQGVKYVFRLLSGTASNLCNVMFEWYEHINS
jgi:hypothetical protein